MLDDGDKRVYVLGGGIVSDLDSAAVRLVDRTLHAFKQGEYDELKITVGAKSRELTQTGVETPATAKLNAKKSGKPDDMAKNWHDKIGAASSPRCWGRTRSRRRRSADRAAPRLLVEGQVEGISRDRTRDSGGAATGRHVVAGAGAGALRAFGAHRGLGQAAGQSRGCPQGSGEDCQQRGLGGAVLRGEEEVSTRRLRA